MKVDLIFSNWQKKVVHSMGEITLTNEEMQRIRIASGIMNVDVIDCIETEDRIVFVVERGFIGVAIGKDAKNLEKLRKLFKKSIKIVEFDKDEERFITNLFRPFTINSIKIENLGNRKVAKVDVPPRYKSKVIGKNGRNIQLIKQLTKRHSSLDDVQIL